MTLKELYLRTKEMPTPSQEFIKKISDATCREETTVRQWLSGTQEPTERAKNRISEVLNIPVEELFPEDDVENSSKSNDDDK